MQSAAAARCVCIGARTHAARGGHAHTGRPSASVASKTCTWKPSASAARRASASSLRSERARYATRRRWSSTRLPVPSSAAGGASRSAADRSSTPHVAPGCARSAARMSGRSRSRARLAHFIGYSTSLPAHRLNQLFGKHESGVPCATACANSRTRTPAAASVRYSPAYSASACGQSRVSRGSEVGSGVLKLRRVTRGPERSTASMAQPPPHLTAPRRARPRAPPQAPPVHHLHRRALQP
jgi:hypothetical protein